MKNGISWLENIVVQVVDVDDFHMDYTLISWCVVIVVEVAEVECLKLKRYIVHVENMKGA